MKRESKVERAYLTPQMMNFSFRESFDEILMRAYNIVTQYINMPIHQIIVSSSITEPTVILNQLKD